MKQLGAILFTLTCLLLVACNADDDVQLSYQHTAQVGFYSIHTQKDTVLSDVVVYGIGREDSMLYDVQNANSLFLNLDLHSSQTSFAIRTQTLTDQVTFYYYKKMESVSGSAGIAMRIRVDSIHHTSSFIDSVAITHKDIIYNESLENVRLFVY